MAAVVEQVHKLTSRMAMDLGRTPPSSLNERFADLQKLLEIVAEIDKLQINFPRAYSRSRWPNMPKFERWCKNAGIKSDRLQAKQVEGYGIGLFAKEDISIGEVLITVPRPIALTLRHLERRSGLAKILKAGPLLKLVGTTSLALALLYETFRKDSFWRDYIAILPADEESPFSFSEAELLAIKHTSCFSKVDSMVRNICRQYSYIYNLFFTEDSDLGGSGITPVTFTFENFRWAMFMAVSRGNHLPCPENSRIEFERDSLAFIPHWDMVNHDSSVPMCSDYDSENNVIRFLAGKEWRQNEQVFTSYGERTNSDFLVHYGFVPHNSEKYAVVIQLGYTSNDSNYELRTDVMKKHNFKTSENFCLIKDKMVSIDENAFRFSLMFVANKEQLTILKTAESSATVDEEWQNKAKDFLSNRLMLMAQACRTGILKAPREQVRPFIQTFVDMEVKLYEESAKFVKTPAVWPSVLTAA
ncbi:Histone-lysine N-methyltransferase setd3 [Trichuris trichiura]|uniref:protein-histidine N-methyltransferase n=1 Tax=Trichuris trichiura TaxID=36087 RepID=A0A077ZDX4_TRITR|nr:Histone-lysine N-methyltransferase setd3 [Trichuris trichiura]